jgi:hypothetical protein
VDRSWPSSGIKLTQNPLLLYSLTLKYSLGASFGSIEGFWSAYAKRYAKNK